MHFPSLKSSPKLYLISIAKQKPQHLIAMTCMASSVLLLLLFVGLSGLAFARLPLETSTFFNGYSSRIFADANDDTSRTKWAVLLAGSKPPIPTLITGTRFLFSFQ